MLISTSIPITLRCQEPLTTSTHKHKKEPSPANPLCHGGVTSVSNPQAPFQPAISRHPPLHSAPPRHQPVRLSQWGTKPAAPDPLCQQQMLSPARNCGKELLAPQTPELQGSCHRHQCRLLSLNHSLLQDNRLSLCQTLLNSSLPCFHSHPFFPSPLVSSPGKGPRQGWGQ